MAFDIDNKKGNNDIVTIRDELRRGFVRGTYIFYGPNLELIRNYITQICKITGFDLKYEDECRSIIGLSKQKTFISNDYVYVVMNDTPFTKQQDDWRVFRNLKLKSVVILVYTDLKKNTKFYQEFEKDFTIFDAMKPQAMIKSLANKFGVESDLANRLINRCDGDFGRCLLECNKVDMYCKIHGIKDFNDGLEYCFENNLICISSLNTVQNFIESFLDEDPTRCWLYLTIMQRNNEPVFMILWDLYYAIKSVHKLQSTKNWQYIDSKVQERFGDFIGVYEERDLIYAIRYITKMDYQIKSGKLDSSIAIEKFLIDFFINYKIGG